MSATANSGKTRKQKTKMLRGKGAAQNTPPKMKGPWGKGKKQGPKRPPHLVARANAVKPQLADPDLYVHLVKGHGIDPAAQANQSPLGKEQNFEVQGMTRVMPVIATISDRTLPLAAMGFVLTGIRNGWMSSIKAGEHPYYAFVYLCDVLSQALTGAAPLIQNAPKALWDLLAAIKPKKAGFKTALVDYSWDTVPSGKQLEPTFQLGNDDSPYYIFWGTMSTTAAVNGYMVLVAPGLPIPDKAGATSFQSLCNYLSQNEGSQMSGDITGDSALVGDTSAFSVCYPEIGYTAFSEGGAATTIYSERKIAVPLLAKFAQYQPTGPYYRGWAHAGKSAGTPSYILPRMLEFSDSRSIYNKASPIFKFYNFDEIFTVLSTAVGLATQNFYANQGNTNFETCPLTSQQVQILLRQCVLSIFNNHLAQDLVLDGNFTPITPFTVGPNGVSVDQVAMLLPTVLCENIRAMCRRQVMLSKEYKNYIIDFVPILGRPMNMPQLGNYEVIIGDTPYLLYTNNSQEVSIRLIDCSTNASPRQYLAFSGKAFSTHLGIWNEWITKLSACLSPLTTVAAESGITAISSIYYTCTQQDNPAPPQLPPTPQITRSSSKKDVFDPRVKLTPNTVPFVKGRPIPLKVKNVGLEIADTTATPPTPTEISYIDYWTEKEIVCNQSPTAPIFKVIRDLIMPCHLSTGEANQASLQTWQTFNIEPFKLAKAEAGGFGGDTDGAFPTINSRLLKQAAYDSKAFATGDQQNEFVAGLLELGKQGRGGFFAQIAGTLAGAILPGSRGMVQSFVEGFGG